MHSTNSCFPLGGRTPGILDPRHTNFTCRHHRLIGPARGGGTQSCHATPRHAIPMDASSYYERPQSTAPPTHCTRCRHCPLQGVSNSTSSTTHTTTTTEAMLPPHLNDNICTILHHQHMARRKRPQRSTSPPPPPPSPPHPPSTPSAIRYVRTKETNTPTSKKK